MNMNVAQKLGFGVPSGIDPTQYYRCLLGPLAFGVSVGMQVTMTAFLFLGPSGKQSPGDQLTEFGKGLARPEHDLAIYAAGSLVTLIAALATLWCWRRRLALIEAPKLAGVMAGSALMEGILAVLSLVVYALLVSSDWFSRDFEAAGASIRQSTSAWEAVTMLIPCDLALLFMAIDLKYGSGPPAKSVSQLERRRLRINKLLYFAVPAFIILVIGVPPGTWRYLAGQIFLIDWCHHLNFFFMGPAISFAHGKAFGTEIYSQYGIGWPLLAFILSHFWAMTYGNLVGLEIVYSCIYYLGLFFLLRTFFKQQLWAAFAVILAIYWQTFSGMKPNEIIWVFPSSTPMRHPMDVWFFLALAGHQRSGRLHWIALAGVAAAFGIFFETETGAYLVVTYFIYSMLQTGLAAGELPQAEAKSRLSATLTFCSTMATTLLALLFGASRGTLFTGTFWQGWVEALVAYAGGGITALPIAELPDAPFIFFMIMVASYLALIVYAGARALHGNASRNVVLLAALAAYGMALLLLFVNRSHPFNLCHATVPFAVVLTALISQSHAALERRLPRSTLPYALLSGLVVLLLTKAEFLRYPSFFRSNSIAAPSGEVSLRLYPPDICGLPQTHEGFVREFQEVAAAIQALAPDGKGVAILDFDDTPLYNTANLCPWSRYASILYMALTQKSLDGIRNDLITKAPRHVVIRGQNGKRPTQFEFAWAPLYTTVTNRYNLSRTIGDYEIWHSKQP
jgi:hypothetical protein